MAFRLAKYQVFLIILLPTLYLYVSYIRQVSPETAFKLPKRAQKSPLGNSSDLNGKVAVTLRMALKEKDLHHFYCSWLRSLVLFWNPGYGDFVIILDEEEKGTDFPVKLDSLRLPFRFRFAYEAPPKNRRGEFTRVSKRYRAYGYARMLYSAFLMDLYTPSPIIAWMDTDLILTMPVIDRLIVNNGKIIVKGLNTFNFNWAKSFDTATRLALGLPMVIDFAYFPLYVYGSTFKNCRDYIIKRLGVKDFEEAFIKMNGMGARVNPVNVILTYAFYFERDLYDWYLDIGSSDLQKYNREHLTWNNPLLDTDILPELEHCVHISYYVSPIYPLEQAICYTQIYLGMRNIPHCQPFYEQANMQLFAVQNNGAKNHLDTWCAGDKRLICIEMIGKRYNAFVESYLENKFKLDTSWLPKIEHFVVKENATTECKRFTYVPFSLVGNA